MPSDSSYPDVAGDGGNTAYLADAAMYPQDFSSNMYEYRGNGQASDMSTQEPSRTLGTLRHVLQVVRSNNPPGDTTIAATARQATDMIWKAGEELVAKLDRHITDGVDLDCVSIEDYVDSVCTLYRLCRASDRTLRCATLARNNAYVHAISALHNALLTTDPERYSFPGLTDNMVYQTLRREYEEKSACL